MKAACFTLGMLMAITAGAATVTVSFTETSGKPLIDAVVYATPVSGKAPVKAATALIDQVKREFTPLVSIMQTGTVVSFPNKDNIRHHVYSFSPAKPFELRLYSGTQAPPVTFDKPGLVTLGCNIHDNMIAYALVVDTPWIGKSDATGKAVLEGVPPGEYEFHTWHPNQTNASPSMQRFSVKAAASEMAVRIDLKSGK